MLYGDGINVTHFAIPSVRFSDHLPLVCDFEIKAESSCRMSAPASRARDTGGGSVDDDGICWLTLDKADARREHAVADVLEELVARARRSCD